MTKFDVFIRTMILQSLSLSQLELSPQQRSYLEKMIRETYLRPDFLPYCIEDRVKLLIQRDQQYFLTLI